MTDAAPDITLILPPEMVTNVGRHSHVREAKGRINTLLLDLIKEQGWLRLLMPKSIGGGEYALPDLLALQEAASRMDGSVGWVIALCGGAGFFAGFVEEGVAKKLFGSPNACVAGTGFPAGTAEEVPGGYRVSGHWRYASGAPHATLFTANCRLIRDGRTLYDDRGEASIRAVMLMPKQVKLEGAWDSLGLRATASRNMVVKETFVPAERTFTLDHPYPHAQGPLYRYPFLQQAEAVLSVTLLGMTRHFLELFRIRILPNAEGVRGILDKMEGELAEIREAFYQVVRASWEPYVHGQVSSPELLSAVGKVAREATRTALRCSDSLYPYGGMEMMSPSSDINLVWRDIHTASQHALLSPLRT